MVSVDWLLVTTALLVFLILGFLAYYSLRAVKARLESNELLQSNSVIFYPFLAVIVALIVLVLLASKGAPGSRAVALCFVIILFGFEAIVCGVLLKEAKRELNWRVFFDRKNLVHYSGIMLFLFGLLGWYVYWVFVVQNKGAFEFFANIFLVLATFFLIAITGFFMAWIEKSKAVTRNRKK